MKILSNTEFWMAVRILICIPIVIFVIYKIWVAHREDKYNYEKKYKTRYIPFKTFQERLKEMERKIKREKDKSMRTGIRVFKRKR